MANTSHSVTIQDIRRELLYFSSDKKYEENDDFINAYTYYGIKEEITRSDIHYDTGSGSGDFNSKQIIFLMMKYLLTIYLFSLHKKQENVEAKHLYHNELQDISSLFKGLGITFTGSPKDRHVIREFLTSSVTEFYGRKAREFLAIP
ncbi:hypothetical protein LZ578_02090 [Jeotgalibaca sp. MA1X17-3]|uniref:hypothetical protein n=1 Tax=Jeotgalibaca sp. MA1X17-3 TaxID=2908211 RepID=UPI001F222134|nr:hypothetical protein [Jeotgalibaca sp. MA1X17-3]UJF15958.1 hypothetical protein LZ578_02090 [Jeotgalibaca sp. MA1X17-3]